MQPAGSEQGGDHMRLGLKRHLLDRRLVAYFGETPSDMLSVNTILCYNSSADLWHCFMEI